MNGGSIGRLLALALLGTATACSSGADTPTGGGDPTSGNAGRTATQAATPPTPSAGTVLSEAADDNMAVETLATGAADMPPPPARPRPARAETPPDLPESNAAGDSTPFPTEVTTFMVDRDGCDHFRGEEPYDAERRAYLDKSIRDLCSGSDAKLADLRARYARNQDVIAALSGYDDRIETDPDE